MVLRVGREFHFLHGGNAVAELSGLAGLRFVRRLNNRRQAMTTRRRSATKPRVGEFQRRLEQSGYTHGSQRFCREVETVFEEQFSEFKTDEQLKRHPQEALRFCNKVREHYNLADLPDDLILGGLENFRKHYKKLTTAA